MSGHMALVTSWTAAVLLVSFVMQGQAETFKTVQSVKGAMYEVQKSRACYKLLNATGAVGCEVVEKQEIAAALIHHSDLQGTALTEDRVVVVPASQLEAFVKDMLSTPSLQLHVKGVLVDSTVRPASQSSAPQFPGAAYAPYISPDYAWNPAGSGTYRQYIGKPMYFMTEKVTEDTLWRATYNADQKFKGGLHVARMQLTMEAENNSQDCMTNSKCLPVGSYSVWAGLPFIPDPTYTNFSSKPITLVVAQVDSNAVFHDVVKAADSPLSGLIAMLTALQLLAQSPNVPGYTRQLVFAALSGEPWDYMGSRRLLWEMANGTQATRGLNISLIDQVVEAGQVGMAYKAATNATSFYLHRQQGGAFGDASDLVSAFQLSAAAITDAQVSASTASSSNPGIPPSSLMSLLRVKPGVKGLVLTEFDSQYINPYYQSEFDDGTNVTVQGMADAAIVMAQALNTLAYGASAVTPLVIDRTSVLEIVSNLTICLIFDSPGMSCPTALRLMNPDTSISYDGIVSYAVANYAGVLNYGNSDPHDSRSKPNIVRFLWNYMGNLTAANAPGKPCDTSVNLCSDAQACIGWRSSTTNNATMGRCRDSTVNYVQATSNRFFWGLRDNVRQWHIVNDAAAWEALYNWPADPMWTESNWPATTPSLEVYQRESPAVEAAILSAALLLMAATAVVSYLGKMAFEKHLKSH